MERSCATPHMRPHNKFAIPFLSESPLTSVEFLSSFRTISITPPKHMKTP